MAGVGEVEAAKPVSAPAAPVSAATQVQPPSSDSFAGSSQHRESGIDGEVLNGERILDRDGSTKTLVEQDASDVGVPLTRERDASKPREVTAEAHYLEPRAVGIQSKRMKKKGKSKAAKASPFPKVTAASQEPSFTNEATQGKPENTPVLTIAGGDSPTFSAPDMDSAQTSEEFSRGAPTEFCEDINNAQLEMTISTHHIQIMEGNGTVEIVAKRPSDSLVKIVGSLAAASQFRTRMPIIEELPEHDDHWKDSNMMVESSAANVELNPADTMNALRMADEENESNTGESETLEIGEDSRADLVGLMAQLLNDDMSLSEFQTPHPDMFSDSKTRSAWTNQVARLRDLRGRLAQATSDEMKSRESFQARQLSLQAMRAQVPNLQDDGCNSSFNPPSKLLELPDVEADPTDNVEGAADTADANPYPCEQLQELKAEMEAQRAEIDRSNLLRERMSEIITLKSELQRLHAAKAAIADERGKMMHAALRLRSNLDDCQPAKVPDVASGNEGAAENNPAYVPTTVREQDSSLPTRWESSRCTDIDNLGTVASNLPSLKTNSEENSAKNEVEVGSVQQHLSTIQSLQEKQAELSAKLEAILDHAISGSDSEKEDEDEGTDSGQKENDDGIISSDGKYDGLSERQLSTLSVHVETSIQDILDNMASIKDLEKPALSDKDESVFGQLSRQLSELWDVRAKLIQCKTSLEQQKAMRAALSVMERAKSRNAENSPKNSASPINGNAAKAARFVRGEMPIENANDSFFMAREDDFGQSFSFSRTPETQPKTKQTQLFDSMDRGRYKPVEGPWTEQAMVDEFDIGAKSPESRRQGTVDHGDLSKRLFMKVKDEIYRHAAGTISTFENEPYFLLQSLRGMEKLRSTYLRQKFLLALDEIVEEAETMEKMKADRLPSFVQLEGENAGSGEFLVVEGHSSSVSSPIACRVDSLKERRMSVAQADAGQERRLAGAREALKEFLNTGIENYGNFGPTRLLELKNFLSALLRSMLLERSKGSLSARLVEDRVVSYVLKNFSSRLDIHLDPYVGAPLLGAGHRGVLRAIEDECMQLIRKADSEADTLLDQYQGSQSAFRSPSPRSQRLPNGSTKVEVVKEDSLYSPGARETRRRPSNKISAWFSSSPGLDEEASESFQQMTNRVVTRSSASRGSPASSRASDVSLKGSSRADVSTPRASNFPRGRIVHRSWSAEGIASESLRSGLRTEDASPSYLSEKRGRGESDNVSFRDKDWIFGGAPTTLSSSEKQQKCRSYKCE